MFTNVIVPLDGSHAAQAAIPVARMLAALGGGRHNLLRVVHRPADCSRSAAAPVMLLRGDGVEQSAAARHDRARVVESVW